MKKLIKLIISNLFFYTGLLHLFRFWNNLHGKRSIILTFHRVSNNNGNFQLNGLPTISISQNNFESLITFLRRHFNVISLQEYLMHARNCTKLDYNSMILSFDDCYQEIIENALPVLKKHNLPAIFFAPTKSIDEGGYFWWDVFYQLITDTSHIEINNVDQPDPSVQKYLNRIESIIAEPPQNKIRVMSKFIETLQKSPPYVRLNVSRCILDTYKKYHNNQDSIPRVMQWEDIQKLHSDGFEIGSHTVSHQFLSTLSDNEVVNELTASKMKLERKLDDKIRCFSYPGGKYNDKTVELVKQSEYECAFTTQPGLNSNDVNLYELKRVNVWDGTVTNFKGKFSRALTAWHLFLQR